MSLRLAVQVSDKSQVILGIALLPALNPHLYALALYSTTRLFRKDVTYSTESEEVVYVGHVFIHYNVRKSSNTQSYKPGYSEYEYGVNPYDSSKSERLRYPVCKRVGDNQYLDACFCACQMELKVGYR